MTRAWRHRAFPAYLDRAFADQDARVRRHLAEIHGRLTPPRRQWEDEGSWHLEHRGNVAGTTSAHPRRWRIDFEEAALAFGAPPFIR